MEAQSDVELMKQSKSSISTRFLPSTGDKEAPMPRVKCVDLCGPYNRALRDRQLLSWQSSFRVTERRGTCVWIPCTQWHRSSYSEVPVDTYFIDSRSAAFLQAFESLGLEP